MKYAISIILAFAILVPSMLSITGSTAEAATIPTISIVSVISDQSVTIRTNNFPANRTFTARMDVRGNRAIGGTVVGTLESGVGGTLTATFNIPVSLRGTSQIAIRLDSTTGGFFSYNWFVNRTVAPVTPAPGTPAPTPHTGIPTFSIQSTVAGESVTVLTRNFPANRTFTVRMGPIGTRAIGGTVVGTLESGTGGALTATFNVPEGLRSSRQVAIRMDSTTGGFFAYNWFYNTTAAPGTPAPTPAPGTPAPTPHTGIPTFRIQSVVRDTSVTVLTNNYPANQTFTVRMAVRGNRAIGGTVVGTLESGTGGALTATFNIPESLRSTRQIAIRMDSPAGFFAYNWFYNTTAP